MNKIQPQYLPLSALFNRRLFRIPDYQRAYSWQSHQRQDLFNDIKKTLQKATTAEHFMAAIVCLKRETKQLGTDDYHIMEVVDGQQRLTTLVILLKAIELSLEEACKNEAKAKSEIHELLVKTESDELLLLQTNHDSSHYYSEFIRNGITTAPSVAKTQADKEILLAIEECKLFVESWKQKNDSLLSLFSLLKNRLFFLLHEIDDERTVYTVFEVLNSRGLEVSKLDTLKSILMGKAFELSNVDTSSLVRDLHNTWRDIYRTIGLRQGLNTESLRFAATLRSKEAPSRTLGEDDAVSSLRDLAQTAEQIREVASWLLKVTKACDQITDNKRNDAVTRIAQARLLATSIHLRTDFCDSTKTRILQQWERVSFRIYGLLRNDARTRVGEYVRLAWKVTNTALSAEEIIAEILNIGKGFTNKAIHEHLFEKNCYDEWEKELRYIFFRYEERLAREQKQNFTSVQWEKIWEASPSDSIEHILPSSKAHDSVRHRLGNLMLLPIGINVTLSDSLPKDKVDTYLKSGLLIAAEVADLITNSTWNEEAIELREKHLIDWIIREWGGTPERDAQQLFPHVLAP